MEKVIRTINAIHALKHNWAEHGKLASSYNENEFERQHKPIGVVGDKRTPFEKDRDRIIHCAAFRRLQGKTQVFGMGGSDFFRTRLTHSLEAAQIGKGIAIFLGNANSELVEAACLAHDIGHPPFGHTGEDVLKKLMKKYGGFEGNAQNLRILSQLEVRSAKQKKPGLNISRATIDALLKYKIPYSKINKKTKIEKWKFYYDDDKSLVKWASLGAPSAKTRSFECEIMDWADEIAYSTHDLEDGIKVGMITESKISSKIEKKVKMRVEEIYEWDPDVWDEIICKIRKASSQNGTELERKGRRRDTIASLIHLFITSSKAKARKGSSHPSRYQIELKINPKEELMCCMLKKLVWELIITDEHLSTLQRKASIIVTRLFEEFTKFDDEDITFKMYPLDFRERLESAKTRITKFRIACDFISGMTDNYATRMYSRLISGENGSIFDII